MQENFEVIFYFVTPWLFFGAKESLMSHCIANYTTLLYALLA